MLRKALVSDTVRGFIYVLRRGKTVWPAPILGQVVPPFSKASICLVTLGAFVSTAYSIQPNYIIAGRAIVLMASWLRSFSPEELAYSQNLLEKFYGYQRCTCSAVEADDQSHFC